MKYLFKNFSFVLLLGLLFSCEGLSQLLTTNVFEIIENKDKPSVPLEEVSDWSGLDPDPLEVKIEKYSAMALTNTDSEALFFTLRENPSAMENVRSYFNEYLDDPGMPILADFETSDEYLKTLNTYQRTAAALAKIEINSTDAKLVDGVNNIIRDYANGTNSGNLDPEEIYKDIFGVPPEGDRPLDFNLTYEKDRVLLELKSIVNAGIAYDKLGESIFNKDFPESNYIFDTDATLIFFSCLTSRIIDATEADPSTHLTSAEVITQFVDAIFTGKLDESDIVFPKDQPNGDLNIIERYLGKNGAVAFIATNYTQRLDILFGGDQ